MGDSEERLIIGQSYVEYLTRNAKKVVVFGNPEKRRVAVINKLDLTRYSEAGRDRIKRNIQKRVGRYWCKRGVMVSLTFDPSKISQSDAWRFVGVYRRKFMDGVNHWRWKRGLKRRLSYLCVVEMSKRGWPHIHIVFPSLRYLMAWEVLKQIWGLGAIDVFYSGGFRVASYICKYITKMGTQEMMLAYMKFWGLRLFSLSRDFAYKKIEKEGGWYFWTGSTESGLAYLRMNFEGCQVKTGVLYCEDGKRFTGDVWEGGILKTGERVADMVGV